MQLMERKHLRIVHVFGWCCYPVYEFLLRRRQVPDHEDGKTEYELQIDGSLISVTTGHVDEEDENYIRIPFFEMDPEFNNGDSMLLMQLFTRCNAKIIDRTHSHVMTEYYIRTIPVPDSSIVPRDFNEDYYPQILFTPQTGNHPLFIVARRGMLALPDNPIGEFLTTAEEIHHLTTRPKPIKQRGDYIHLRAPRDAVVTVAEDSRFSCLQDDHAVVSYTSELNFRSALEMYRRAFVIYARTWALFKERNRVPFEEKDLIDVYCVYGQRPQRCVLDYPEVK